MKNFMCNSFDSLKKDLMKFYNVEFRNQNQNKNVNHLINDEINKFFSTTTQLR